MRRLGFVAVASLALVALGAPVVDARQGHGQQPKTATFVAKTNTATQGGNLRIIAKVKHPARGASFSASATVHFASGDVTVTLNRRGKSFVAGGKAPVAADETPGAVPVDVTITYDDSDQEVETEGTVEADEDDGDDQGDDATCDPATTTCDDQGGDDGDGPGTGG
jgi:hypothetical protein